jgi:Nucleotidyl transferase AbiEii toxin, Type IV TA system
MNNAFASVIEATEGERRDLFLGAAARIGTAVQNVEKDFWVCWVLDALFNGLEPGGPRLLFKGGTSLSKAFGLISRFSEDIDITVFRDDIGQPVNMEELDAISGKQRRLRLDAVREACKAYINGPLFTQLNTLAERHVGAGKARLESDPDDPDKQTLLFWYPAVTGGEDAYIRSAVKIESGAKSALDPHTSAKVVPYVAHDLADLDLTVPNVTTVRPERTFWDKITILHGLRQWHERRGELRHGGQRVSRHYYDVYRLMQDAQAKDWLADRALGADCARHARLFFGSPDLGLETALSGTMTLVPVPPMRDALSRDYEAMSGMIFGGVPSLDDVLAAVAEVERVLNARGGA